MVMKKALILAALAGTLAAPASAPAATLFATDSKDRLLRFSSDDPTNVSVVKNLNGLPAGVDVLGLDMRPRTGQLWILGSDSKLYTATRGGKVSVISPMPFSTPLSGRAFGFDFNPAVDRIRIVSDAEQNLRANPENGNLAMADKPLNPGDPTVTAAAYTNSQRATANAMSTTLFVIDGKAGMLYTQMPPNDGTLAGSKMLSTKIPSQLHFDIAGAENQAFLTGRRAGSRRTELFTLDVATGKVTVVGRVGSGKAVLTGMTARD